MNLLKLCAYCHVTVCVPLFLPCWAASSRMISLPLPGTQQDVPDRARLCHGTELVPKLTCNLVTYSRNVYWILIVCQVLDWAWVQPLTHLPHIIQGLVPLASAIAGCPGPAEFVSTALWVSVSGPLPHAMMEGKMIIAQIVNGINLLIHLEFGPPQVE